MPPQPLHHLGEEPIYCEAIHDPNDDVYSGSDDDHYEGPLHRRLHIEKKAIDFLAGHVPVLLSAKLRGPFDSQHWNNPWRSRRATRQTEYNTGTQTTRSNLNVERARGHGPDQLLEEELPTTQGTSLYPLPSPEITNPPSARKNPYMEEHDYNRVETWRETVKGTSVSRDPFWLSQQDDSDDVSVTRKRSANQTWLHKRELKKRKYTDMRSPYRTMRLQEAESSSEDELSMPSTTPTHKAARSCTQSPKVPKGDGSPRRPTTATKSGFQCHSTQEQAGQGRTPVEKIQASQLSVRQRSSIDAARRLSKYAARMAVEASGSAGESPGKVVGKNSKPIQPDQFEAGSATGKPKTYAKMLTDNAVGQQDNSFCFHKIAESTTEIAAAAVRLMAAEYRAPHEEDDEDASVAPNFANAMEVDSSAKQQILSEAVNESETVTFQVTKQIQPADEVMENDEPSRKDEYDKIDSLNVEDVTRANDELEAMVDEDAASKYETVQELESNSESVATGKPQVIVQDGDSAPSTAATTKAAPEDVHVIPVVEQDVDDSSGSEWSSFDDTQDLSTVSPKAGVILDDTQSIHNVIYQSPDGQTDPEWTTYVDTQEFLKKTSVLEQADDVPVIEEGLNDPSDLEWSTFVNTEDQSAAAEPEPEGSESDYEDATGVNSTNPAECMPVVEDDDDSNSESSWSTCRSITTHVDADHAGDTSHEPVPQEASQDTKPSQASVGSIIDAYVEADRPSGGVCLGQDSTVSNESHQDSIISMPGPDAVEEIKPVQEQGGEAINSICATPMEIKGAMDGGIEGSLTDSGNFDETTISIEPRQMADAGMLGGTALSMELREVQSQPSIDLEMPQVSENGANTTADSSFPEQTTASVEPLLPQSAWATYDATGLQMPQDTSNETGSNPDSGVDDITAATTEPLEIQSPLTKYTGIESQQPAAQVAPENDTPLHGSSSVLNGFASKSLPFTELQQSPWMAHTPIHSDLPTPDFTVSIKAFSDFATPSPTKKPASFNGSILRDRIRTPVFQKPRRRVHFAPLPGEEEAGSIEADQKDEDTIYVEEEVSYFDPGGHKTGTVRVPRPLTRVASPPPMDVSSSEADGLLDHDSKFSKHFEAMAKRKKNPSRKVLRLLRSDSQHTTTASQDVGAMAERFIQASQTRRKALEMAEADAAGAKAAGGGYDLSEKSFSPIAIDPVEDQENVEPVDDVSAVLDNLGEFLDNTWGVGLGTGVEDMEEDRVQPLPKTPQGKGGAREVYGLVGDPMVALNINVWAE